MDVKINQQGAQPSAAYQACHVQNKDSRSPRKINTQNTTTKASLWKSMMNLIQAITTPAIITRAPRRARTKTHTRHLEN